MKLAKNNLPVFLEGKLRAGRKKNMPVFSEGKLHESGKDFLSACDQ